MKHRGLVSERANVSPNSLRSIACRIRHTRCRWLLVADPMPPRRTVIARCTVPARATL